MLIRIAAVSLFAAAAWAQTVCAPTPRYSTCDLVFDVPSAGADQTLDLHAEFRSPHQTTALVNAFWDGGTKWVIRFAPAEAGVYNYRLTSAVAAFNGKEGQFTATDNKKSGWLRAANLHHFAFVEGNQSDASFVDGRSGSQFRVDGFTAWKPLVDTRAQQHFNHLAITLVDEGSSATFPLAGIFSRGGGKDPVCEYARHHRRSRFLRSEQPDEPAIAVA